VAKKGTVAFVVAVQALSRDNRRQGQNPDPGATMAKILSMAVALFVAGILLAAPLPSGLKSIWGTFEDPDKDCEFKEKNGVLSISVLGKDHDLAIERGKMNSPRAMQSVDGDFTVQVKVAGTFEPRQRSSRERVAYNGAGLFIRKDDNNFITLDRGTFWDGMMNIVFGNFELRVKGRLQRFGNATDLPLDNAKETWLKIERIGNEFKAYASQEPGKWHSLGSKTMAAPKRISVGVAARNSSLELFTPQFSEFELKTAAPPTRTGK
jgi:regulation of enolase protein 1 (concanavalin A-like superfamily)